MMAYPIFPGDTETQTALLAALAHWCTCCTDGSGVSRCCAGHKALVSDKEWLQRQLLARLRRDQLNAQEFQEDL